MNAARLQETLRRWTLLSLAGGAVGGLGCLAAALLTPRSFYPAWLVSLWFWLGLSLGALAVSMLHHLTGGGWGVPIRRLLESAAAGFLPLAVMATPIWIGMHWLYPWSDAETVAADALLSRKTDYLNVPFFLLRAGVYFAVWIVLAAVLNRATFTDDLQVQDRRRRGLAQFSGFGFVLWALSVTFASIDWAMSIEPHWYSSMYPVLFMAGQAVSAFAFSVIAAAWLRQFQVPNLLTTSRLHDLGNFLLAFVMFWAYVSFMQFLIIWSGNLPEESPWCLLRAQGGWQVVAGMLATLHFLTPFLLLLIRRMKRAARRLAAISGLLLAMRLVDLCWLLLPPFIPSLVGGAAPEALHSPQAHGASEAARTTSLLNLWPLLFTLPAVGGFWLAFVGWRLSKRALVAVYDPPKLHGAHPAVEHAAN